MADKNQPPRVAGEDPKAQVSAEASSINERGLLLNNVDAIMKGVFDAVSELKKLVRLVEISRPWATATRAEQDSSVPQSSGSRQPTTLSQVTPSTKSIQSTSSKDASQTTTQHALSSTEMSNENSRLQEALKRSEDRNAYLGKRLNLLQEQLQEAISTSDSLREAVPTGKQKVLDQEILTLFCDLREKITGIAHSSKISMRRNFNKPDNNKTTAFSKGMVWEKLDDGERTKRIQSKIFEILYSDILSRSCFGLDGYKIKDSGVDIEVVFNWFEFDMTEKCRVVPRTVLLDWRVATLACADALKFKSTKATIVANKIWDLLKPLIVQPPSTTKKSDDTPTLYAEISELCQKALELTLMMRKSGMEYRCQFVEVNTQYSKNPRLAKRICKEGGTEPTDLVAFTLFGALIKQLEVGKEIIIERAEVVVQGK